MASASLSGSCSTLRSALLPPQFCLSFSESVSGYSPEEEHVRCPPLVHSNSPSTVSLPAVSAKKGKTVPPSTTLLARRRQRHIGYKEAILNPPLKNKRIADRFLNSPQLSLKTLPLLGSCLPPAPLIDEDKEWMDQYLPEAKQALGLPLDGPSYPPETPMFHFDTLLYLAFQHFESRRNAKSRAVRVAHSRIWFLGHHVLELALAEYFLLRYPRETPACIRERVWFLINKRKLPKWIKSASLDGVLFPDQAIDSVKTVTRLNSIKVAFWALIGALYLTMGMNEVYRVLFEVFGLDPDHESCQPKPRPGQEDVDHVFPQFEEKQLSWQDLAMLKSEEDAVFAKPFLFRACVPPGMQRFRGNLWEVDSLPHVLRALGYPLLGLDEDQSIASARNADLELGLQLCFLHPSKYKFDHPRFCNERFEYLGSKIQDVVMAEKLLMRHLDGPGSWLQEKHRRLLFNRICGKYFREKRLQDYIAFSEKREAVFENSRKLRNLASTDVSLALHGLGYAVYGKAEVRRLMFQVFDFERLHVDDDDGPQKLPYDPVQFQTLYGRRMYA